MIWALVVHAASVQDRDGAKLVLRTLRGKRRLPRLELVWADASYAGHTRGSCWPGSGACCG